MEDAPAEVTMASFVVVLVVPVFLVVSVFLVVVTVSVVPVVVPVVVVPVCWVSLLNLDDTADDSGWWCTASSDSSVLVIVAAVSVHGDPSCDLRDRVGGSSRWLCSNVDDSSGIYFNSDALLVVGDRGGVPDGGVDLG
jgi:hypothetical protein